MAPANRDSDDGGTRPGRQRTAAPGGKMAAVEDFRRSAFWNLKTRIANVCIVVGVLAVLTLSLGGNTGVRLAPTLVCALGGLVGITVYFSRSRPLLLKWLLVAAVSLTVLGIAGLAVAAAAGR
jgi:hypothetical protein